MLKPGDSINDRSTFELLEEGQHGRAILSDQYGVFYVTDENGKVQYAGENELHAEIEYFLSVWNEGER